MKGIIRCIGVGPGDPELMTLKAVRLIKECGTVFVPGSEPKASAAYGIASAAVPETAAKRLIGLDFPMTRDAAVLSAAHRAAAKRIESVLDTGENAVFLTLGDPGIYCTFGYVAGILENDGYTVEFVSGVTSFCAAAAKLRVPLAERDEPFMVLPGLHTGFIGADLPGNLVIMKPAGELKRLCGELVSSGRSVCGVTNCGMEGERVYTSASEIPDEAGYFTLLIAKKHRPKTE